MEELTQPECWIIGGSETSQAFLAGDEMCGLVSAPPGVPAERVKILRAGYAKALENPDLTAEVERSRLDRDPSTGEEIETVIKGLMEQKREVIARLKIFLEN